MVANGGSDKWKCLILWILEQLRRRVIWTLDNLDRPLFLIEKNYLLLKKISPFVAIKGPLSCIKHTKRDMDWRTKLKIKRKWWMSSEQEKLLWDYSWKVISIKKITEFFAYTPFIFTIIRTPFFKLWRASRGPTFKLWWTSWGPTLKLWAGSGLVPLLFYAVWSDLHWKSSDWVLHEMEHWHETVNQ